MLYGNLPYKPLIPTVKIMKIASNNDLNFKNSSLIQPNNNSTSGCYFHFSGLQNKTHDFIKI